jgi:hypothetical protein
MKHYHLGAEKLNYDPTTRTVSALEPGNEHRSRYQILDDSPVKVEIADTSYILPKNDDGFLAVTFFWSRSWWTYWKAL